ncbi:unnamed protein product [Peronospora belbahrii]|uniref:Amino acid transporter transmembrane domain-containing protein n=1 Tax=Peronospora belbahrii TaxID=622444 RepID=A0ABN8CXK9_9STRA|nr:unnamed protein product [Peronospora belbahrii]
MLKRPFLTGEDYKSAFNLFCCIYGIGTLGMPGNFARAGPKIAVIAMAFMAFANIYSSITMSKVMLLAPKSVKTFGDLGEWSIGMTGRWLCTISQMGSCLLIPCVFLVLGGQLLDGLFPNAFSQTTWTILMALMVLPVCLVPTLKEGSGAAFAGCMGTIVADVIGVTVVIYGMRGHPSVPFPDLKFSQVASVFGNLSLAYGAGIVIPDLQRQHSDPTRMPRVVGLTVGFVSILFLILSSTAYSAVGCQISGNLLFTIYPDKETGMTAWICSKLGHSFYIAERLFLGMHKSTTDGIEIEDGFEENTTHVNVHGKQSDAGFSNTNNDTLFQRNRRSKLSYVSVADSERVHKDNEEEEAAEYTGSNVFKYVALRVFIVAILVVLAIVFKDHFSEFADFVGASCITTNCILLPIIFYLIKTWDRVPMYEKIAAIMVVVVCFVLGCYVTYTTGKALFLPKENDVEFPFCNAEYENTIYYNYTAVHEA